MKIQTTAEVKRCAQLIHQTIGEIKYQKHFTPVIRKEIKLHTLQDLISQVFGFRNFHELHKRTTPDGLNSICELPSHDIQCLKNKTIELLIKLINSLGQPSKNEAVFLSHALVNTLFNELGAMKHKSGYESLNKISKICEMSKVEVVQVLNSKKTPKLKKIPTISCINSGLAYAKFYREIDESLSLFTVWNKKKLLNMVNKGGGCPFESFWNANTVNKRIFSLKRIASTLFKSGAIDFKVCESMRFEVDSLKMHTLSNSLDDMFAMISHCLGCYMSNLGKIPNGHRLHVDSQELLLFLNSKEKF